MASEQNDIEARKEQNENDQSQNRSCGRQNSKKHHREAKYDSGEVLEYKVIRCGSFEVSVNFSKENNTRTCGSREHTVHCEKLFFQIVFKEDFSNDVGTGNGSGAVCLRQQQ